MTLNCENLFIVGVSRTTKKHGLEFLMDEFPQFMTRRAAKNAFDDIVARFEQMAGYTLDWREE